MMCTLFPFKRAIPTDKEHFREEENAKQLTDTLEKYKNVYNVLHLLTSHLHEEMG